MCQFSLQTTVHPPHTLDGCGIMIPFLFLYNEESRTAEGWQKPPSSTRSGHIRAFSTPRPQTHGAIEHPAVALQVIWKLLVSLLPQFARLRAVLSKLNLNFKLH